MNRYVAAVPEPPWRQAMKIAVTSTGANLDSPIDPRFGRAAYLIIVDTESLAFEAVDNTASVNAFKGAGIQAAAAISRKGAKALLTGYCGPKAFEVLQAAKIKVANDVTGTVKEAIAAYNSGSITFSDSPNAEAHW
jgi:predicted Fe-Mo cluster-binding NifX family protein